VCALGAHTPVYPFLKASLPLVGSFRYPAKFFVLVTLAVAALATTGWDALGDGASARWAKLPIAASCVVAALAAAVALWVVAWAPAAAATLASASSSLGLQNAATEGERMAAVLRAAAPRALVVAALAGLLVWHIRSGRPQAELARFALFALVAVDLLVAGAGQNPTLDVALLGRPQWAAAVSGRPDERVFISSGPNLAYVPLPYINFPLPPNLSTATVSSVYDGTFPSTPTGAGLRSPIDLGVSGLRPREYERLADRYDAATSDERSRFLERAGVRYYVVPAPPAADAREIARIPDFNGILGLYERAVRSPRAEVVPGFRMVPDEEERIAETMSPQTDPAAVVLLASEPPPAAGAAEPREPAAEIVAETPNAVTIRAGVPAEGGFLVLRDAFDPNWRVQVDGREAPLLQADVLFRAVRLGPGEHAVAFRYAPRPLVAGAAVSASTLALLCGVAAFGVRRRE
jgi:hypothetical protein